MTKLFLFLTFLFLPLLDAPAFFCFAVAGVAELDVLCC